MNLKKMALLTLLVSLLVIYFIITYNIPIILVPNEASKIEYVLYSLICILTEVSVLSYLFLNMFVNSKIELDKSLKQMFLKWFSRKETLILLLSYLNHKKFVLNQHYHFLLLKTKKQLLLVHLPFLLTHVQFYQKDLPVFCD